MTTPATYTVKVIITDDNLSPKSSSYTLSISITNGNPMIQQQQPSSSIPTFQDSNLSIHN